MRRLFSTFATGLPGAGLLVMRLVAGTALVVRATEALMGVLDLPGPDVLLVFQILLGVLLLAGLWTPVAGTLAAVLQVWRLLTDPGDPWIHVLLATLGGALALLGPGRWSLDAQLFGWRRVEIRGRHHRPDALPDR